MPPIQSTLRGVSSRISFKVFMSLMLSTRIPAERPPVDRWDFLPQQFSFCYRETLPTFGADIFASIIIEGHLAGWRVLVAAFAFQYRSWHIIVEFLGDNLNPCNEQ